MGILEVGLIATKLNFIRIYTNYKKYSTFNLIYTVEEYNIHLMSQSFETVAIKSVLPAPF